jgi:ketosteroid isomerase-like protein
MKGKNMRETRARCFAFFIGALILAAAPSAVATAQEKGKEKPPKTTADAWRQALPPETELVQPAGAAASDATPRATREEIEQSLFALERKWMESLKLRDANALSQIISDDFTFASPQLAGAGVDRAKYFDHALHDLKLAAYEFSELKVRLYGRTAIISGRLKQNATVAGADWSGLYLITDVWVNRDGTWRVVGRHASLLPVKK